MNLRKRLLQTTMLSGILGGVLLSGMDARAADLSVVAAPPYGNFAPYYLPAVDGVNWKVEGLGGSLGHKGLVGSEGALSIPLGGQYGLQVDGAVGSWGDHTFGNVAPHLFWRDPSVGLFGVYSSHTWWDQFGGVYTGNIAGEAERYWGRFTLQGIAGVEWGNTATNIVSNVAGTTIQTFDIKTRFFDQINLKYYLGDNWDAYVGHRYLGGKNALAVGTEFALPVALGPGLMASAFLEGRVGESNSSGIWGGVKLYFGQHDKPLIARQRQDDPNIWSLGSLFTISNSFGQTFVPAPPAPSTSSGSFCSGSCSS